MVRSIVGCEAGTRLSVEGGAVDRGWWLGKKRKEKKRKEKTKPSFCCSSSSTLPAILNLNLNLLINREHELN
ncbi:hypothetical protein RIF29_08274 [Crotalaria pallida]|uniref:Uncharacterized protein n=1 Tax=Crotalaria pallida TaxID=3830 RepID=A0AAN9J5F5_CROPI